MTEAQVVSLTAALRAQGNVEYRCWEFAPGDFRVQSTRPGGAALSAIQTIATNNGTTVFTDRAEFR